MKAAVFHTAGEPMAIEEISIDNPGPREVLVRTSAVGLCHSDLHFVDGTYETPLPTVLGHEAAGIIEKVGSGVSGLRAGDKVIACLSVFCGHCHFCVSGRPFNCRNPETKRTDQEKPRLLRNGQPIHQFYNLSGFAEMMLVHEHAVVKIQDDFPLIKAALIGCGVVTGFGAVVNTAKVEFGSTVAVIGCGGVGLSATNGAAVVGAGRIIAIDIHRSKLELAKEVGATDVIDASKCDVVEAVREITGGGVDYSFEAIGRKETAEQAFSMLNPSGTATIVGMISRTQKIEILANDLLADRKLIGSNMGSNRFRVDMPRYAQFYLDGRLKLDTFVANTIRLEEINAGMDKLRLGDAARTIVSFE